MVDTLSGLAIAVGFLIPGFIVADLAESRRATRPARTDLELLLRALVYALVFQGAAAATGWTGKIADELTGKNWDAHLGPVSLYVAVVCIVLPTIAGLGLSSWLRRAEQQERLRPWHYALGGRDQRKSWDFMFGRSDEGRLVLLTVDEGGVPVYFLGEFGDQSYATQAPTDPPELYLEKVWPSDRDGNVSQDALERDPQRGMWVSGTNIQRVEMLHINVDTEGS